jgi:nitronate monooxygenase
MLQDLLDIRYPIIQAPMAGTDTPEFVAAACNAGVLGSLGAQYRTPDEIKKAIAEIRRYTDKPFAVNLFALNHDVVPGDDQIAEARDRLQKYYDHFGIAAPSIETVKATIDPEAQLETILAARVPVFSFTLGIPKTQWIYAFKSVSTVLIGAATNVKEARALEAAGIDAVTAQGSEAGGHRGTFIGSFENSLIGGMALIPQIVDAVKIPIIAAGGIMDGRGIAAALALGAHGVQLGTAFLTVAESPAHAGYKRAIREHDADDTTITKVFSGGAARGIENAYIEDNSGEPQLPFPYQNSLTRSFRKLANLSGQIEYTNLWSGQGGRLAREASMDELVKQLISETEDVLAKLSKLRVR